MKRNPTEKVDEGQELDILDFDDDEDNDNDGGAGANANAKTKARLKRENSNKVLMGSLVRIEMKKKDNSDAVDTAIANSTNSENDAFIGVEMKNRKNRTKNVLAGCVLKFFRNPLSKVLVLLSMMATNLLIYNEDPVSYSEKEANVYGFGRIYNYAFRKYPPNDEPLWICWKVFSFVLWIVLGMLFGKYLIHDAILRDCMESKLFKKDMGSWTVMFFTACVFVFSGSFVYNVILSNHFHDKDDMDNSVYLLSDYLGMSEKTFQLASISVTWDCCLFTLLISIDEMFHDAQKNEKRSSKYGCNSNFVRSIGKTWMRARGWIFLAVLLLSSAGLCFYLASDYEYGWITANAGHFSWNEVSRCWVASFIVVLEVIVFMQDWEFPRFKNGNNDVKIMGCNSARAVCKSKKCKCSVAVNGKWVNYVLYIVMTLFNFNLFVNQYLYEPRSYGQVSDDEGYVRTIYDSVAINGTISVAPSSSLLYNNDTAEIVSPYRRCTDNSTSLYPWCTFCTNVSETVSAECFNVSRRFDIRYDGGYGERKEKLLSLIPVAIVFLVFFFALAVSVYRNSKLKCFKRIKESFCCCRSDASSYIVV